MVTRYMMILGSTYQHGVFASVHFVAIAKNDYTLQKVRQTNQNKCVMSADLTRAGYKKVKVGTDQVRKWRNQEENKEYIIIQLGYKRTR